VLQGRAVKCFKDSNIANIWIIKRKILRLSNYNTTLKMRTNKASVVRAEGRDLVACRKCHIQKETLGHITGQCACTKKQRIQSQDVIKG
jgi:hypothetical protein